MQHTVTEHKLSGGACGLLVNVAGSNVVSLQVRFNSGFQFADRRAYEVPHVMEHLLSTVTQKHPGPNEFIIEAQKNGAYVNAHTSVDTNGYTYECADFELMRILDLVEEQLTEPRFESSAMAAEVGNVREELSRNTTNHAAVCSIALAEKAYPKLWMNYDQRIAQLPEISLGQMRKHYADTHTSANARFFVSGNFSDGGEAVAKRLDKIFGRLPVGKRLQRSREVGRGLATPVVEERDIKQLYYQAMMYFGELTEEERRAMTLLRLVLVGGMGARILGEARRRGLAYSVRGAGHAEPGNSSFGFVGYVTPDNAEPLFELIGRAYGEVRDGKLTVAELEAAKDLLVGSIKRSTQTAGDILGWYMEPYDESGEIRDFDRTLELMREVNLDEVVALAGKAAAGARGVSLLGAVQGAGARTYANLLEPMWVDS